MNTKQITHLSTSALAALLVFVMISFSQTTSAQEDYDPGLESFIAEIESGSSLSTQASSLTWCVGKITAIQTHDTVVLIKLDTTNWMRLAAYGNTLKSTTGASAMLSTALTAQAQDKQVMLRYLASEVSSCTTPNWHKNAKAIRLVN